jgi:hypothetical protein
MGNRLFRLRPSTVRTVPLSITRVARAEKDMTAVGALPTVSDSAVSAAELMARAAEERFQSWRTFLEELAEAARRADAAQRLEWALLRIPSEPWSSAPRR